MFLINNKPWIDLEPFIDMEGLNAIHKDIVLGIVKSKLWWQIGSSATENLLNKNPSSIVDHCWPDILKDPNNPDYEYFKALKFIRSDCLEWTSYVHEHQDMGELLSLRSWKNIKDVKFKFSAEHTMDFYAYEHFPTLKKWIDSCKAFDEIGRVIMWRNRAHQPGTIHKDTYLGTPDSFILINLNPDRKVLFLLDDDGNEVPITSKAFIFDPRNWHGSRGLNFSGWTLRIDGKFNEDWSKHVGIDEYLKNG